MKSKWSQSEVERAKLEVKMKSKYSKWSQSEVKVKSKWIQSDFKVKSKWSVIELNENIFASSYFENISSWMWLRLKLAKCLNKLSPKYFLAATTTKSPKVCQNILPNRSCVLLANNPTYLYIPYLACHPTFDLKSVPPPSKYGVGA